MDYSDWTFIQLPDPRNFKWITYRCDKEYDEVVIDIRTGKVKFRKDGKYVTEE